MSQPKPPNPPPLMVINLMQALAIVEAGCILTVTEDEAGCYRENERINRLSVAATDRVVGNRAATNPVTWDDLRYLLLAQFKLLSNYLDGNLVDDAGPAGL